MSLIRSFAISLAYMATSRRNPGTHRTRRAGPLRCRAARPRRDVHHRRADLACLRATGQDGAVMGTMVARRAWLLLAVAVALAPAPALAAVSAKVQASGSVTGDLKAGSV